MEEKAEIQTKDETVTTSAETAAPPSTNAPPDTATPPANTPSNSVKEDRQNQTDNEKNSPTVEDLQRQLTELTAEIKQKEYLGHVISNMNEYSFVSERVRESVKAEIIAKNIGTDEIKKYLDELKTKEPDIFTQPSKFVMSGTNGGDNSDWKLNSGKDVKFNSILGV